MAGRKRGGLGTREAEVRDLGTTILAEQHVVGLEVAVDHACVVNRSEPARGPFEHLDDVPPRADFGFHPLPERAAFDVLHRDEHGVVVGARVVDRDEVGVAHLGHGPGFVEEAFVLVGVALVVQHLDRHGALELGVERRHDHAHASSAEPLPHLETTHRDRVTVVEQLGADRLQHAGRIEGTPTSTDVPKLVRQGSWVGIVERLVHASPPT